MPGKLQEEQLCWGGCLIDSVIHFFFSVFTLFKASSNLLFLLFQMARHVIFEEDTLRDILLEHRLSRFSLLDFKANIFNIRSLHFLQAELVIFHDV